MYRLRGGVRVLDRGNPADVQTLLSTIRQTMELAPLRHLMICYDDVTPQLQPEEAKRFARPALAHGAVMEQVYRLVKELNPATVVSFCGPYYQGRRHKRWRPTTATEAPPAMAAGVRQECLEPVPVRRPAEACLQPVPKQRQEP